MAQPRVSQVIDFGRLLGPELDNFSQLKLALHASEVFPPGTPLKHAAAFTALLLEKGGGRPSGDALRRKSMVWHQTIQEENQQAPIKATVDSVVLSVPAEQAGAGTARGIRESLSLYAACPGLCA